MATVATGTPRRHLHGRQQRVDSLQRDESICTPMTGRVVSAATTPAKCAAAPAPTMNTLTPFLCAPSINRSAGRRPVRRRHCHLPREAEFPLARRRVAAMISASESEPIRMSIIRHGFLSLPIQKEPSYRCRCGTACRRSVSRRLPRRRGPWHLRRWPRPTTVSTRPPAVMISSPLNFIPA